MSSLGKGGFTILEGIVALAIVGFAAVAAVEAVGSELRAADRAVVAYTVAALAQDRLAAVTTLDGRDIYPPPDSVAQGLFPTPLDRFRWTTSVSPAFGQPEIYEVTIIITSDRGDYTLRTWLYRPHPAAQW